MTCMETVLIAGQVLYCNGKHKSGSRVHAVDFSKLPSGFLIGDLRRQLIDQGIAWVKWSKNPA